MALITINGARYDLEGTRLTYDALCFLTNHKPTRRPTVGYNLRNGQAGSLIVGESVPLVDGAIFNVVVTNNA